MTTLLRCVVIFAVVLLSFVTGDAALAGRTYVQDAGRSYVQDAGRTYVQDAKGSLVAVPELDTVVIDDEVGHLL